ncbi:hypothetical protein ER308_18995 [Egibacter rhizosphaerae]|uniref:Putative zinc-finger domain-containing protein n=1 Tax=Egibacter rhizosphaerae TaxID=1670831 RepID=A0A411YJS3_9ACTN|nr:zf-HC2 domain-containing protein [Egibacter rhizosphaerae]QBI21449.1 hypothetical protein ER308_18995 [Egibacter rhizosphaerae]
MGAAPDPEGHEAFDGMAVEHVLGNLSEDDARRFRAHLLQCPHCRARVGELRSIAHDLASVEQRAARERTDTTVETKPRADDAEPAPSRPATRRRTSPWILILLVIVVGIASWSVLLRGEVEEAERELDAREGAAEVLAFGQAWQVAPGAEEDGDGGTESGDGVAGPSSTDVRARVHEDDGALAVLVEGLVPGAHEGHELRVLDGEGETIASRDATERDGTMLVLLPQLPGRAEQVELLVDGEAWLRADRDE